MSAHGLLRVHRLAGDGSGDVWLRVAGEADIAGSDVLADVLAAPAGGGDVHLDLARLRFMDLSGLRPLAALARQRQVVLHHPPRSVRRLADLIDTRVELAP